MNIRKEESGDYKEVFDLIENAFENEEYSDRKEQFLVERLRRSEAFVPQLSLVAEVDGQLVGYILMTKIKIVDDHSQMTIGSGKGIAPSPSHRTVRETLTSHGSSCL